MNHGIGDILFRIMFPGLGFFDDQNGVPTPPRGANDLRYTGPAGHLLAEAVTLADEGLEAGNRIDYQQVGRSAGQAGHAGKDAGNKKPIVPHGLAGEIDETDVSFIFFLQLPGSHFAQKSANLTGTVLRKLHLKNLVQKNLDSRRKSSSPGGTNGTYRSHG